MNIKHILASVGSVGIMLGTATPALAANINLSILQNGSRSENRFVLTITRTTLTTQTNNTSIVNDIVQVGNTGGNKVEENTGGGEGSEFSSTTGNVDNGLVINNTGGTNISADPCDCVEGGETITGVIDGNGYKSESKAKLDTTSTDVVTQDNETDIETEADQIAKTGDNKVEENTGVGTNRVTTGTILNRLNLVNLGDINSRGVMPTGM